MKLLIFIILILSTVVASDDIEALLESYKQKSDLSNKTKNESAGNLIVYTRDDLDRMQVETLKDILKSLRSFSYAENRISQPDLLNQDPIAYYSKAIRIYLNENELLNSLAGSGFIVFGDMEMDMIDHVEIYEGFPSFEFGVEPATIVIRLYTKDAKHDEGGRVKLSLGSYHSNKENAYYAGMNEDFSYFVYLNHSSNNRDNVALEGQNLYRDKEKKRFYASMENERHKIELHYQKEFLDTFLGSLVGALPTQSKATSSFFNIATHSKFLDDESLTLNVSYSEDYNNYSTDYNASSPVIIPPSLLITSYRQSIKEKALTATLKKVFKLKEHTFTTGVQYRHKHFDLSDIEFNGVAQVINQPYDTEDIYSFFLQDSIEVSPNDIIIVSVMNQQYKRYGDVKTPNTLQLRAGYIYSNEKWVSKTFWARQEFAPEPYMTVSPYYGNANLEKEVYTSIFQEISYKGESTLSKIVLGYGKNENMPFLDNNYTMQNSHKNIFASSLAAEFTLFFRKKDKLELRFDYVMGANNNDYSNYVVRMLNSIGSLDIFNELIINAGYDNVETGYDYSAGIRYKMIDDLILKLKGENIFNKALQQQYYYELVPNVKTLNVSTIDRKITFSIEYLF
ncbi:hypothetical protein [Sulfurimonas sp.]